MINWLIENSLKLKTTVVALTIILMFLGGRSLLQSTAFDVFPEFAPKIIEIQTEAPGLSTTDVETIVTVPIENALNGVSHLDKVRSKSVLGLSSVVLYFKRSTDLTEVRQLVQERLSYLSSNLPAAIKAPVMLSPLSSTSRVLKIGLSSKSMSQVDMTTLAKWTIRPRLMAVPGVANVAIWGQRDKQYQVLVDPQKLRANSVGVNQVVTVLKDSLSIEGGGFIDTENQRLAVTHSLKLESVQNLASIPVKLNNGTPVNLSNVAQLKEGFPPPIGDAVINRGTGLLLIVEKQPWGNTLEVTKNVEEALKALGPGLGDLEVDPGIFRPATFIEMSLENLNKALLIGCLLVILVLIFFLNNWRTSLISVLAIPTSLLAAAVVLKYQGGTLNTMVIAGLIIALGEVVDDAIIDVENITRRLKLNKEAGHPQSDFDVVLSSSLEVRSAVVYGSIIVGLVLFPVLMLDGLSGAFFRPLAISYMTAIAASLFVALTLTPALSLLILPGSIDNQKELPILIKFKENYENWLRKLIDMKKLVFTILISVVVLCFVSLPFLGEEFLPHFKEYDFLMHWVEKPGTSIEAMKRITIKVSNELLDVPGVRNFGAHIGRAEVADEVVGPNFTELWISLDPKIKYDETVSKIQSVIDGYPGLYRDLLTYLRERIKEVLTGSSASLVIRIYGDNLDNLELKSKEISETIKDIQGIADLKVQPQVLVPQINIQVNTLAAANFGISPGDIKKTASIFVKGIKVGEFIENQNIFDIAVIGADNVRESITSLQELLITTPNGETVPLRDLASIIIEPTPNIIKREYASRYTEVSCNVSGRALGSVAKDIQKRIDTIKFDKGYHAELLGEYKAQQAAKQKIMIFSLVALLGIIIILQADFKSIKMTTLLLSSLPFAFAGGILGVFLTGGVLSLGSIIGFVTVLGIAARNSIMLLSHYRHLQLEEGKEFGLDLIIQGASERLTPILMTSLAAILALLPLAISGDKPGHEIEHPMSIVIIGGLLSSVILNLFILPIIYWKYGQETKRYV
jgi:CzcA family heavy metal efflux pump